MDKQLLQNYTTSSEGCLLTSFLIFLSLLFFPFITLLLIVTKSRILNVGCSCKNTCTSFLPRKQDKQKNKSIYEYVPCLFHTGNAFKIQMLLASVYDYTGCPIKIDPGKQDHFTKLQAKKLSYLNCLPKSVSKMCSNSALVTSSHASLSTMTWILWHAKIQLSQFVLNEPKCSDVMFDW